jgi:regulator of RNase E activity RraA
MDAAMGAPKGPLTWKALLEMSRIDVPTMSNTIEEFKVRPRNRGFMRPEVQCMFPELGVMVGYAVTCKIVASRERPQSYSGETDLLEFLLTMPAPRVLVIEDLDDPPGVGSWWGEMHATQAQAFGCVGSVTNGGVRDLVEVSGIGFKLFAQHAIVSHAYCHVVEVGKPVTVGGLPVESGDLLHGDMHGVHQIPLDIAAELPAAARKKREGEFDYIDFYRSPDFTVEKWRERRRKRG